MNPWLKTVERIKGSNVGNPRAKTTNPCSFFKLMVSPTTDFKKLRLPETFASALRDDLSEVCHLTVPTGETHQVALVEENNHLWFQNGWEEFVDRFSIGYGYFMTFIYDGNSKFRVSLFDLSACEIFYQCDQPIISPLQNELFLGDLSPTSSEQLNDGDDRKNIAQLKMDSEDDEMNLREGSRPSSEKKAESSMLGTRLPIWVRPYKAEMKDMIAAGIPMPVNPFFVVVIRPYNLGSGGFLNIPRAFARAYMKCKARGSIVVEICDGTQWAVRCCKTGLCCSLGKGWTQLTQQACLEVKDVCLFELTDAKDWVLKLYVVRSS